MHSITFYHCIEKTGESSSKRLLAKELNTNHPSVAISQCFLIYAYAAIFCTTSSFSYFFFSSVFIYDTIKPVF